MNKERSYRRFLALCITLLLLLLAAGCGIMEGPETQAVSDFGYQITSQADAKPAVSASTLPSESIGGSDSHSAVTAGQGIGETATRAVKPEPTAVAPTTERPQETAAVSPKAGDGSACRHLPQCCGERHSELAWLQRNRTGQRRDL